MSVCSEVMIYYQFSMYCLDCKKDILKKSSEYHSTTNSSVQEKCMRKESTKQKFSVFSRWEWEYDRPLCKQTEKAAKENGINLSSGTTKKMSWSDIAWLQHFNYIFALPKTKQKTEKTVSSQQLTFKPCLLTRLYSKQDY